MQHNFNVEIAKEYGIHEAIILENIYFWTEKNKANKKHFYDGSYWTYNSKKSFTELFPYLTERQIDYTLKKLLNEGFIKKGNYNKNRYDKTLWYAITEKGYSILQNCSTEQTKNNTKKECSMLQNCSIENTQSNTEMCNRRN
ncbi:MAG: hypothetical protein HFJ50_01960 [Clostridia bacterium]|jgi:DNA-binding HxlR family transcriptional regulator|nr:hypothetical protein [Clostridia bacterium]